MPVTNLNGEHFSQEEKAEVEKHWESILRVLRSKGRNLSPEERKKYGSVNEENKLVVQKVIDYHTNQPHLSSPEVDYKELQADWDDRMFLAGLVSKMTEGMNIANNIRITHDYDAISNARIDYRYTRYRMDTEPGAGFETKYRDLLYFFKTLTAGDHDAGDKPEDAPGTESK